MLYQRYSNARKLVQLYQYKKIFIFESLLFLLNDIKNIINLGIKFVIKNFYAEEKNNCINEIFYLKGFNYVYIYSDGSDDKETKYCK